MLYQLCIMPVVNINWDYVPKELIMQLFDKVVEAEPVNYTIPGIFSKIAYFLFGFVLAGQVVYYSIKNK